MFRERTAINEDVVKINHEALTGVHMPHEGTWGVRQAEWNDEPFIEPLASLEGCFPFVSRPDAYLMIAIPKVQFGKDLRSG